MAASKSKLDIGSIVIIKEGLGIVRYIGSIQNHIKDQNKTCRRINTNKLNQIVIFHKIKE